MAVTKCIGWEWIRSQERSSPDRTPDREQAHFVGMQLT